MSFVIYAANLTAGLNDRWRSSNRHDPPASRAGHGVAVFNSGVLTSQSNTTVIDYEATSSGAALIEDAMFYDGDETNGIHLWDAARHAFTSGNFISNAGWRGPFTRTTGSRSPGLLALGLGYNDETTDIPVATYKANMVSIISAFRSIYPRTPVLLIAFHNRGLTGLAAPWSAYVNAMKEIADADRAALLLDLRTWAPVDWLGNYTANHVHPNDAVQVIVEDGLASLAHAR